MSDIHDIKPLLEPDYLMLLLCCLFVFTVFSLVLLVIFIKRKIREKKEKHISKQIFDRELLKRSLELLKKIKSDLEKENKQTFPQVCKNYFHRISEAVRITGSYKIQQDALNMTKNELKNYKIKDLNDLLVVCYTVQFSEYQVEYDFCVDLIEQSIKFVKLCF